MRLLSRALFTFALLGGLAYGSYAFGKYVLSSHLFGPKGATIRKNFDGTAVVTRPKGTSVTGSPRVDVEVMPADSADEGAPPPLSSLERTPRRASRDRDEPARQPSASIDTVPDTTSNSNANDFSIDPSGGPISRGSDPALSDEDKPRRRRKRRRPRPTSPPRETSRTDAPARSVNPSDDSSSRSSSDSSNTGVIIDNGGSNDAAPQISSDSNDSSSAPAPRIETRTERRSESSSNSDSSSEEQPRRRRRRERVRRESASNERSAPAPRVAPRSAPARRLDESPVPRPEGDSGGGSPVPIPE